MLGIQFLLKEGLLAGNTVSAQGGLACWEYSFCSRRACLLGTQFLLKEGLLAGNTVSAQGGLAFMSQRPRIMSPRTFVGE